MKKILIFLLPIFIVSISGIEANAYYVNIPDKSNENNENVDVFKPESGANIKPSPLAQMMENATKNVTQNNTYKQNKKTQPNKQYKNSWF